MVNNLIPNHVKELEKSGKWKQLYPVIRSKDGEIIDGKHRKAADPNWKEEVVPIVDEIEKVKMMVKSNLDRKDKPIEEKRGWALRVRKELKKRKENYGVRSIAHALDISKSEIQRWLGVPSRDTLLPFSRKLVPMFDEYMLQESEINYKDVRKDSYHTIKEGGSYPTLKRRSWFFHEDGGEFSLREYAQVQDFPNDFIFVGTKEKIKDQIGNAVSPKMAEYVARMIPKGNAIELFAGCGGMSLGFEKVGHKILWMNEFNKMGCRSYHANFPKVIINPKDINDIKINEIKKEVGNRRIDIIFGGPPCQGFSLAGVNFKDDDRNKLYKEFIRVLKEIKPKYFVMENVKGILSFKEEIKEDFEKEGYNVEVKLIKGEEIGMKQKRHRVFFIGKRK